MLSEYTRKIKEWIRENEGDIFTALIIVLTAISAFGLGRLSAIYDAKVPLIIKNAAFPADVQHSVLNKAEGVDNLAGVVAGKYLASKNGTKYYSADCPAASRIAEQNRIWFNSTAEAEQAGL
ncbi:MAG: hypothetical protein HZA25_01885, partial [Candidatus Niyogibacteria bacterium]|nr:hypothetical protein [Candidatus Niyogibacteria bacterium]